MTTVSATTILSSAHANDPEGTRLSTILARYPRIIHSEMLTHRALSKNSASSRAISINRMIWEAEHDYAEPLVWTKEQKGMQGYEFLTSHDLIEAKIAWHQGRLAAIAAAKRMSAAGCHKQMVNRLLEPYIHITVLYSGTDWNNFLALRDHHAAEPHIRLLAKQFSFELKKPAMQILEAGEWHTPWVSDEEREDLLEEDALKLSSARNASTSYKTVDGFDMDLERAFKIYDKLVAEPPVHASPFEHVAQAAHRLGQGYDHQCWANPHLSRNFRGFYQYRSFIEGNVIPN